MQPLRKRIYEIFAEPEEGDWLGNFVTGSILVLIAVNVTLGILETVEALNSRYASFFYWFEVVSVAIFTAEYLLRLWACTSRAEFSEPVKGRFRMATQPMSVIDLLAIAPFYLQFLLPSGMDLRFIRMLRLFRLFRLFRMASLASAVNTVKNVFLLKKEQLSIAVFVLLLVVLFSASLMYLCESGQPGTKFTSIPQSMWWAMVTVTTIGYGDMYPETPMGQILGAVIGFVGVCVFALPVAILGAGFVEELEREQKESQPDSDVANPASEAAALNESTLDAIAERVAEKVIAKMERGS